MPDTHALATEARPRIVLNRRLISDLLTDLDLHSARDRAEFLGTSVSVANRMLREPSPEHPEEHVLSAETIAAVLHAFPDRDFDALFTLAGGDQ